MFCSLVLTVNVMDPVPLEEKTVVKNPAIVTSGELATFLLCANFSYPGPSYCSS